MSHAPENSGKENTSGRKLHRDWRMWAIVLLMLGCMAIYLLTMDESVVPVLIPGTNAPAHP